MKKIFALLGSLLLAGSVFAQGPADALLVAENHYEGTARTLAMGNAFTALGGDLGAISINPASSGVYRCSEFTVSPSFITARGDSYFNGSSYPDSKTGFTLSNTGFITTVNTGNSSGLMNYNFGFTVNRTNSFNNIVSASGYNSKASILGSIACSVNGLDPTMLQVSDTYEPYNNASIPWNAILAYDCYLINPITGTNPQSYISSTENIFTDGSIGVGGRLRQDYYSKTTGGTHEFSFNFGGNWNDNLFLGVNLNLISVDYTVKEYYSEIGRRLRQHDQRLLAEHRRSGIQRQVRSNLGARRRTEARRYADHSHLVFPHRQLAEMDDLRVRQRQYQQPGVALRLV